MPYGEPDVYENGFRLNVCIVLCNENDKVLLVERADHRNWWQFPQGGMKRGESPLEAVYRELKEELGLDKKQFVRYLGSASRWVHYRLPRDRLKKNANYIGQKQKWFFLRLCCHPRLIQLDRYNDTREARQWKWVDIGMPLRKVARFKRRAYLGGIAQLAAFINNETV